MSARKSTLGIPTRRRAYIPTILGLLLFGACGLSDPANLISTGEESRGFRSGIPHDPITAPA